VLLQGEVDDESGGGGGSAGEVEEIVDRSGDGKRAVHVHFGFHKGAKMYSVQDVDVNVQHTNLEAIMTLG
jgi:hypothetical protein